MNYDIIASQGQKLPLVNLTETDHGISEINYGEHNDCYNSRT